MNDADAMPSTTFARRLRQERERAHMSQTELARRLVGRLDPSAISKIEGGSRGVRLDEAVYLAQVLGVPLAELLTEHDAIGERIGELEWELAAADGNLAQAELDVERYGRTVAFIQRELDELRASRRST